MTRIQWPAERFYWAVIDGVELRRPGPLPPGLLSLAADDIPVDIDTLHAVGAQTADRRVLVCAAESSALEELDPEVISLRPCSSPDTIESATADLELLVGRFEPRSVGLNRIRRHAFLAGAVLSCCALIAVGFNRRAVSDIHAARALSDARAERLSEAGLSANTLAHRVEQARDITASRAVARDVTTDLAALLRVWPETSEAFVESLSFDDGRALATISLNSDPGAFLAAFTSPPGWRLQEPRLNSSRGLTRMTLELRREATE